ncbi:hypothetical protein GCM10022209_09420 [Chitinophaga oryziterrae]
MLCIIDGYINRFILGDIEAKSIAVFHLKDFGIARFWFIEYRAFSYNFKLREGKYL